VSQLNYILLVKSVTIHPILVIATQTEVKYLIGVVQKLDTIHELIKAEK
jgi:hypothetical protein